LRIAANSPSDVSSSGRSCRMRIGFRMRMTAKIVATDRL
jgi:hypothetical protein